METIAEPKEVKPTSDVGIYLIAFQMVRSLSRLMRDETPEGRAYMEKILAERERVRAERLARSK